MNKKQKSISLSLNQTLAFREDLIEKKEFHRIEYKKLSEQLSAVNGLLESFGILNFTGFDKNKKFSPIIDNSKNNDFFKLP